MAEGSCGVSAMKGFSEQVEQASLQHDGARGDPAPGQETGSDDLFRLLQSLFFCVCI